MHAVRMLEQRLGRYELRAAIGLVVGTRNAPELQLLLRHLFLDPQVLCFKVPHSTRATPADGSLGRRRISQQVSPMIFTELLVDVRCMNQPTAATAVGIEFGFRRVRRA